MTRHHRPHPAAARPTPAPPTSAPAVSAPPVSTPPASAPPVSATAGLAAPDGPLTDLVTAWLPAQRWFAGGAADAAAMAIASRAALPSSDPDTLAVELVLVADPAEPARVCYQVPLAWRTTLPPRLEHAVIGRIGDVVCYDALADDEVTAPLLRVALAGSTAGPMTGLPAPGEADAGGGELHGLPLTGEQSNTSIVFGSELIMKFFRRLEPGINPDAEIGRALGPRHYTSTYRGELRTAWDGAATTTAMVSRFIPNSADAWSTVSTSVRDLLAEEDLHPGDVGGDFANEAFRLGGVIAQMHRDLAEVFGDETMPAAETGALLDAIRASATGVAARVPQLAELMPAVERTLDGLAATLAGASFPAQRIHGDLHLGQVLRTVEGWVVIDFEGEPAVSLAERRRPKSPLRDVAGMLRSFDYAARQPLVVATVNAQLLYRSDEWLARNRSAFLDGYADAYGTDPRERPALLTAFELAKAVYEVDYEERHRPAWVKIPLEALRLLTAER